MTARWYCNPAGITLYLAMLAATSSLAAAGEVIVEWDFTKGSYGDGA